ncbi:uncharacterized protein BX663DRAFT_486224 [Cokeromyces recurvatus]|uniref:uncharacterized protein n=1 Tax=Cokeromyces recurvatus TaxID=90255 RepID=UPI00221F0628|nr:uncharacterized protein BX663DRAFT_486224 [Cokeromyces recurvatus]KAI7902938.1 hypothetical protein BX663DRAFT_486224 [Cokeromyces recurvatus]
MNTKQNLKDLLTTYVNADGIPEIIAGEEEWEEFEEIGEDGPDPVKADNCAELLHSWFKIRTEILPSSLADLFGIIASNICYGDFLAVVLDGKYYAISDYVTTVFRWGIYELKQDGSLQTTKLLPIDLHNDYVPGIADEILKCKIQIN